MIFRKIPVDAAITLGCAEKAAILNELYHVTLEPGMRENRNYLVVKFREWQKAFPWMSLRKIQRYLQELKDLGMIAYVTVYDENGKKGDTSFSITAKGVETLLLRRKESYLDQDALAEESELAKQAMNRILEAQNSPSTYVTGDVSPRHRCRLSTSPVSQLYKKEQQEGEQQEVVPPSEKQPTAGTTATTQSDSLTSGESQGTATTAKPRVKRERAAARTQTPPTPPTLEEWIAYIKEKWPAVPAHRAERAYAGYEAKNWMRDAGGRSIPISEWRGAARTAYLNWKEWHPEEFKAAVRDLETAARNNQRGPYAE